MDHRVKLVSDCCSEWGMVWLQQVSAHSPPPPPQGTKLEPLLFVIMINDLGIPGTYLLKYDDDTPFRKL